VAAARAVAPTPHLQAVHEALAMPVPPHLWHAGVGWIYCTGRLLTHRRAGREVAVSCFTEGSCVRNAAMAAGAITRSRGGIYRP
jgi:hypothetical protein